MTWSINLEANDGQVDTESLTVGGTLPDGRITLSGHQTDTSRGVNVTAYGVSAYGSASMPAAPAPQSAELDPGSFARAAYRAYGEATGGKNFRGEPMPAWEDLGDTIRGAWIAAAGAIRA